MPLNRYLEANLLGKTWGREGEKIVTGIMIICVGIYPALFLDSRHYEINLFFLEGQESPTFILLFTFGVPFHNIKLK